VAKGLTKKQREKMEGEMLSAIRADLAEVDPDHVRRVEAFKAFGGTLSAAMDAVMSARSVAIAVSESGPKYPQELIRHLTQSTGYDEALVRAGLHWLIFRRGFNPRSVEYLRTAIEHDLLLDGRETPRARAVFEKFGK
jgi:hypothetical protein